MQINPVNSTNFQAKFLYSDSLKQIAEYAVEKNKFEKLNNVRKNIDSTCLRTRLLVEFGVSERGIPQLIFTRFVPKKSTLVAKSIDDYVNTKTVSLDIPEKKSPLKFAYEKIIKMGNNVPNNKIFRNVVINK